MWLTFNMLTILRFMKSSICKIFHRIINVWNFTFLLMAPCTYVMRRGQRIFLNDILNLQRSLFRLRGADWFIRTIFHRVLPLVKMFRFWLPHDWDLKLYQEDILKTWRWCWGMNKIHQTASGERWRFASAWFPLGCSLIFTLITRRYRCWCILP